MMYKLIYFAGFLIRQFVLPNPFAPFGENAELINLIAGGLFIPLSYLMAGLIYDRGSNPASGSVLFNMFYIFNTLITYAICFVYPTIWLMIIIAVAYFTLFAIVAYRIKAAQ